MSMKTFLKDIFSNDTDPLEEARLKAEQENKRLEEEKIFAEIRRQEEENCNKYVAMFSEYGITCIPGISRYHLSGLKKDDFVYEKYYIPTMCTVTDQEFTDFLITFFKKYDEYQNNKKALEARKIDENK